MLETLRTLVPVLLSISLSGLVLAVGLHAGRNDLLYVLRRPVMLAKAILAVIIIPPIASGLIVTLAPLTPVAIAAIMLMAISPVPPFVPGKQLSGGGRKEYAYGLYATLAMLTVVSAPVVLAITAALFGSDATMDVGGLARSTLLTVVAPLALGLVIRELAPAFAERIWKLIFQISIVLAVVCVIPILAHVWPAMRDQVGNGTVAAMAAVTLIALAGGHLLGGPNIHDRSTLAIASCIRHPGIAISIAGASFNDPHIPAAILLFTLTGIVLTIPYTMWIKRRAQHEAAAE